MNWLAQKYKRYKEIQRHHAGEKLSFHGKEGAVTRLYLSDWVAMSRFEVRRQEKHADHTIHWMPAEEILKACEPYDVISFDVFDTLILRNCGAPENLFLMLEKQSGIPDFAEARKAAERMARQEKGEVTLQDIYAQMERNGTVSGAEKAMEEEWRMEKALAAPHPAMLPLMKALTERGKRIIAVSDMYLSSSRIGELLEKAGYPQPERIFVSCEENAGKAGSAIYRKVREELNLASARVLHLGDNEEADGFCAEAAGWDTALLQNPVRLPWEMFRPRRYAGDFIADSLRWQARYDGQADRRSGAWQLGYLVTGPLTVGFCGWIRKLAKEKGWEKLFFCSRDGWMMYQVYTKYLGEAEYLPVSRAAAQMLDAEKQPLSYCDNNFPPHLGTGETVGQVLGGMGLEELLPLWRKEGLNPEAAFDENAEALAEKLILRDREKIAEAFAPARENARAWLEERLRGVKRAAVIDTGWKGSAGGTLRAFALEQGLGTALDTVLMGTCLSSSVALREERGELISWLFSPSHDLDRLAKQFEGGNSLACTLLEMLFMTSQPQLLSYAGEGFTYGREDERFRSLAEDLQAGALAFAEDYDRVLRETGSDGMISPMSAWSFFEELLLEKEKLLPVFGSYVHAAAPVPEALETTFEDRMRQCGWI